MKYFIKSFFRSLSALIWLKKIKSHCWHQTGTTLIWLLSSVMTVDYPIPNMQLKPFPSGMIVEYPKVNMQFIYFYQPASSQFVHLLTMTGNHETFNNYFIGINWIWHHVHEWCLLYPCLRSTLLIQSFLTSHKHCNMYVQRIHIVSDFKWVLHQNVVNLLVSQFSRLHMN